MRLPDGSPAEKVEVTMSLMQETKQVVTDQQGAVFYTFNLAQANVINFIVSRSKQVGALCTSSQYFNCLTSLIGVHRRCGNK